MTSFEIIIPAKNEADHLEQLLPVLRQHYPDVRITVIDDGSTDGTSDVVMRHGARAIRSPYSKGNGASIKTGARHAEADVIVFMDGDGQHRAEDVSLLLKKIDEGYDMAVGARDSESQSSWSRGLANRIYNRLAGIMTGKKIDDLTSGFRAVRTDFFKQFIYLLPNGFSYPTTITMAFFRAGYSVSYVPITAEKRLSGSHINPMRDGVRFLLIIFRVGTLYSPLKLFLPISAAFFVLGAIRYVWSYLETGQFTNMSALLFITSMLVFLIGLVSEQITSLLYSRQGE